MAINKNQIMNDKNNLTVGSPLSKIMVFMLPVLLGNVFQQLYNLADTIIVGRILGAQALAAVGATGGISFMVFGFSSGISSGMTVLTSQFIGAGDEERARKSVAVITAVGIVLAVLFTLLGITLLPAMLRILQVPEEIYAGAYEYQKIIFIGWAGSLLYWLDSSILRALGDSRTPLIFLILSTLLNIGLDYAFIILLHTGVGGAAAATILAQALSGIACLVYSLRKYELLRLTRDDFRFPMSFAMQHVRIGLPISIQNSITGLGVVVFQSAVNHMGADAIAAYTACSKVQNIITMPMFAISTTIVTFTAQNFGAGKRERIREGIRFSLIIEIVFSIVCGALVILFSDAVVALFVGRQETEVLRLAHSFVRVEESFLWLAAVLFIYRAGVQGMGNSRVPMIGGFLELAMRVFTALVLAAPLGFAGLGLACPLAWALAGGLNLIFYYRMVRRPVLT